MLIGLLFVSLKLQFMPVTLIPWVIHIMYICFQSYFLSVSCRSYINVCLLLLYGLYIAMVCVLALRVFDFVSERLWKVNLGLEVMRSYIEFYVVLQRICCCLKCPFCLGFLFYRNWKNSNILCLFCCNIIEFSVELFSVDNSATQNTLYNYQKKGIII